MSRDDEAPLASGEAGPMPTFCRGNWRQLTIILAVSAAAVLAFALRSYVAGDRQLNLASWPSGSAGSLGGAGGLKPVATMTTATANDAAGDEVVSNLRPVAATMRASFNEASRRIRPATLAVRASYGTDPQGQLLERAGSAVVVDPSGYAVTCTHVVIGATTVSVRKFREANRWSPARIVASDGDLTLLQVSMTDGAPLTAATLGDSAQVAVGDWVLAVGHPFALGTTVTAGIVSRRDVTLALPGGRAQNGLFQTDAAINEGSSGGPLVNVAGEVIGINAAIYAPTGAFSGAGFAIPANQVRAFLSSALGVPAQAAGPRWGLGLVALTPDLATELSFPGSAGVVVSSVATSSAAERAQLVKGDVITKIAGQPVSDVPSAMAVRDRLAAGERVPIEFFRLGVAQIATLTPEAG
jgi:S1-C subfamily serine protease